MISIFHLLVGIFCTLLYYQPTHSTVIAQGNGTGGVTFSSTITAKAFDHFNGNLYLGLANTTPIAGSGYAISYLNRAVADVPPIAIAFAPSQISGVAFLKLITAPGEPFPDLAVVATNNPRRSQVVTFNGDFIPLQSDLLDASGGIGVNGMPTAGIIGLAASNSLIFSAVKPNGGNFGQPNGGIAVVAFTANDLAIFQTAAQVNDSGIKAQRLDATTPNIKIGTTNPTIVTNQIALYWDSILQRLYIALGLSSGTENGDGVIAVVVGYVNNTNNLIFVNSAPAAAFSATNNNNVVGAVTPGPANRQVGIRLIRTMHTSTGPSYLIVNGGLNAPTNMLYALPLVNLNDPTNPAQGVLAAIDSFNPATKQFETPAVTNMDLTNISIDTFAIIGGGPLPIQPNTPISDLVVAGDTVYVSMSNPQSTTNDTGIFYSQALFNDDGTIASWTPWSKRAFPFNGFPIAPLATNGGRVAFFDVDAVTSQIWAVDGSLMTSVATTTWDFGNDAGFVPTAPPLLPNTLEPGTQPMSLPGVLNMNFSDGCFCALDLDSATPDFVATSSRYALFGGVNKVAFALTAVQLGVAQVVTPSFALPSTFFVSHLPRHAGSVTSLAYSQQSGMDLNYFFAGTQQGLFVFTDHSNAGFSTTDLDALNQIPFPSGHWSHVTAIEGSVVALKASANTNNGNLYVLTTKPMQAQGFESKLYSIPYQDDSVSMFSPSNIRIIATTATTMLGSDLSTTSVFLGFETVGDGTTEQIILASNRGLFGSNANQTGTNLGIISAANQQEAQWQLLGGSGNTVYTGIFGPNVPAASTTWPIALADGNHKGTFENSIVQQVSALPSNDTILSYGFDPVNFDTNITTGAFSSINHISGFWSDGLRRLFIIKRTEDRDGSLKLFSIPFNNIEWNLSIPKAYVLVEEALQGIHAFYWMQQIGATGILLAGTNTGVVALE
jgi:hypothetical protein